MVCRDCEDLSCRRVSSLPASRATSMSFPYHSWVHGPGVPFEGHSLRLVATGASAALRDIVIKCSCDASRSLDGAFERHTLAEVSRCQGRRPWLGDQKEQCGAGLRTLQRGASNVWFSSVLSALSIPPWSDGVFQVLGSQWPTLKSIDDPQMLRAVLKGLGAPLLARGHDLDELVQAVVARQVSEQATAAMTSSSGSRNTAQSSPAGRRPIKISSSLRMPRATPEGLAEMIAGRHGAAAARGARACTASLGCIPIDRTEGTRAWRPYRSPTPRGIRRSRSRAKVFSCD